MTILTEQQVGVYALRALGLNAEAAVQATARARGESGFNTRAHNVGPRDDSYGLWQINMKVPNPSERLRQIGIQSPQELYDPAVNARAMAIISNNGRNWSPWAYQPTAADLASARAAVGNVFGGGGGLPGLDDVADLAEGVVEDLPIVGDVYEGITDVAGFLARLAGAIFNPAWWLRIGKGAAAVVLVLIGVVLLARELMPSPLDALTQGS